MAKKKEVDKRASRFVSEKGDLTITKPQKNDPEKDLQVVKEDPKRKVRQITETKATCKACGNVWFYGKSDSLEQMGAASSNCGKSMMCCTCSPCAMFIPNQKVTDLNKCPKCNSKAVNREKVTHDV